MEKIVLIATRTLLLPLATIEAALKAAGKYDKTNRPSAGPAML
jgi:hypothetical protein